MSGLLEVVTVFVLVIMEWGETLPVLPGKVGVFTVIARVRAENRSITSRSTLDGDGFEV